MTRVPKAKLLVSVKTCKASDSFANCLVWYEVGQIG